MKPANVVAINPAEYHSAILDGTDNLYLYQSGFLPRTDDEMNWGLQYGWEDDNRSDVVGSDQSNAITIQNLGALVDGGGGDDRVTYRMANSKWYSDYSGKSELHGGGGNDTLILDFATIADPLDLNLVPGVISGTLHGYRTIVLDTHFDGFENIDVRTGSASDYLVGMSGHDRLSSGAGNDILVGGAGKDILTGGEGSDLFRFHAGNSGVGGNNRDIIDDFQNGVDKIQLVGAATIAISQIGDKALLRADFDGDGVLEQHYTVGFGAGSTYADFGASDIMLA